MQYLNNFMLEGLNYIGPTRPSLDQTCQCHIIYFFYDMGCVLILYCTYYIGNWFEPLKVNHMYLIHKQFPQLLNFIVILCIAIYRNTVSLMYHLFWFKGHSYDSFIKYFFGSNLNNFLEFH